MARKRRSRESLTLRENLQNDFVVAETCGRQVVELALSSVAHRLNQYRAALLDIDPTSVHRCLQRGCFGLCIHTEKEVVKNGKKMTRVSYKCLDCGNLHSYAFPTYRLHRKAKG